jgi:hypothetical protein
VKFIDALVRPGFPAPLLFRDEKDATILSLAFANKFRAFEIAGEADDVARLRRCVSHMLFPFRPEETAQVQV